MTWTDSLLALSLPRHENESGRLCHFGIFLAGVSMMVSRPSNRISLEYKPGLLDKTWRVDSTVNISCHDNAFQRLELAFEYHKNEEQNAIENSVSERRLTHHSLTHSKNGVALRLRMIQISHHSEAATRKKNKNFTNHRSAHCDGAGIHLSKKIGSNTPDSILIRNDLPSSKRRARETLGSSLRLPFFVIV